MDWTDWLNIWGLSLLWMAFLDYHMTARTQRMK